MRARTLAATVAALTLVLPGTALAADTGPPTVDLVSPTAASWHGNQVDVSGTVADPDGLDDIQYVLLGLEDSTGTYHRRQQVLTNGDDWFTATLDTADVPEGSYVLSAEVVDGAKQIGTDVVRDVRLDHGLPDGEILSPETGTVVSGDLTVEVRAEDPPADGSSSWRSGVATVWVDLEGNGYTRVDAEVTPLANRYTATLDTTQLDDGPAWIGMMVEDAAGNRTFIGQREVHVDNVADGDTVAPTVSVDTASLADQPFTGAVPISGVASDAHGIVRVELLIDGGLADVATLEQVGDRFDWSATFETRQYDAGEHTLQARALDPSGNVGLSVAYTVEVGDNSTPPTVTLFDPDPGATVSGQVDVRGQVTDPDGDAAQEVTVTAGSAFIGTGALNPNGVFSVPWDTTSWPDGPVTVTVTASDAAGNTSTGTVTVEVDNLPDPVTRTFSGKVTGNTRLGTHTFTTSGGSVSVSLPTPESPGRKLDDWTVRVVDDGGATVGTTSGVSGDVLVLDVTVPAGTFTIEVGGKGDYAGEVTFVP